MTCCIYSQLKESVFCLFNDQFESGVQNNAYCAQAFFC